MDYTKEAKGFLTDNDGILWNEYMIEPLAAILQRVASRQREIDAKKAALAGELAKKETWEAAAKEARSHMPKHGEFQKDYQDGVVQQTVNIEMFLRAKAQAISIGEELPHESK